MPTNHKKFQNRSTKPVFASSQNESGRDEKCDDCNIETRLRHKLQQDAQAFAQDPSPFQQQKLFEQLQQAPKHLNTAKTTPKRPIYSIAAVIATFTVIGLTWWNAPQQNQPQRADTELTATTTNNKQPTPADAAANISIHPIINLRQNNPQLAMVPESDTLKNEYQALVADIEKVKKTFSL